MQSGRERLQDWIERSKFKTQRDAAETLELDPVSLSLILSGARKPGLANAVKIEHITGISVESWLLSEVSDEPEPTEPAASNAQITKR